MNDVISKRKIKRLFLTGKVEVLMDELISEYRLKIRLEGKDFIQAMVSPYLLEEFVLGFLLTRRLINGLGDISSLEISEGIASVERNLSNQGSMPDATLLESTGSRNIDFSGYSGLSGGNLGPELRVKVKSLIEGIRMLKRMPIYNRTGGTHCAILFSPSGKPLFSAEDLGRHNSVDKVIGGALKKEVDFNNSWLAVSGRLPRDMVLKAVLVGIPLIASVSAVTSEGVETGEESGVTVVGFGREGRINCYSHPRRII